MPYILDVAPIVDGHTADIGYSGCLGENAVLARLCADLAEYRAVVTGGGPRPTVAGFGVRALRSLLHDAVVGHRAGWSPLWGPGRASDHPATPGMWAVEPHIRFRGVGVKFEELLVVTEDDAFWLDDDLPHVRRWRATAATA